MGLNKVPAHLLGFSNGFNSEKFVATGGQTLFTLSNGNYQIGKNRFTVYIHGVKQAKDAFTETSSTSFTLSEGVPLNSEVEAVWYESVLPAIGGHNANHKKGGVDELKVDDLGNYKELIDDRLGNLSKKLDDTALYVPSDATLAQTQAIFDSCPNYGTVSFAKNTVYTFNGSLVLGSYKKGIIIKGNNATLHFTNTGHGLDISSVLGQFDQNHIIESLKIQGPDPYFPGSGYVPVSTGAGIYMDYCYSCVLRDVIVFGFKYGMFANRGIKNIVEGNSYFYGNQYGVYIGNGAFNANNFYGVKIRENRKCGLYIDGTSGTSKPTANVFHGCSFESNVPYPAATANPPNDSIAIFLKNTYENIFRDCYFENHAYAIWIDGTTHGNKFETCRFETGGKVAYFKGSLVSNILFNDCRHNSNDFTTPSIESDSQISNIRLVHCEGFNVIPTSVAYSNIDMLWCKRTPANTGGSIDGSLRIPDVGIIVDPYEGTTRGTITGLGTTTATLNVEGASEVALGSQLAAASANTTITSFNGLRRGQIFAIYNHQNTRQVTIHDSVAYRPGSTIILNNNLDCVLKTHGDMIVFWVNYLGRAIEISRSLAP